MIWFTCKQCGKTLGRADNSAGALVFCDCGQGLRVPWESTAPAPEVESLPVVPKNLHEPVRFADSAESPPSPVPSRRRRRAPTAPIDPNICFNHASADKAGICQDCGLSFCGRCLTTFQNTAYCAACKNYRTRVMQRRPDSSKLALMSFVIALVAGPFMLLLIPLAASRHAQSFVLLALLPPVAALVAGVMSMRWMRAAAQRTGQHLAVSGMSLGAVVGALTIMIVVFGHKIWT